MADITDTIQKVTRSGSGLTPSYTAVADTADTHYVNNDGKVFLHFKKTGAGNATVTIATQVTLDGNALADLTATVVATTGDKMLGPFDPAIYNVPGTHNLTWTVDDNTGLTVAAIKLEA